MNHATLTGGPFNYIEKLCSLPPFFFPFYYTTDCIGIEKSMGNCPTRGCTAQNADSKTRDLSISWTEILTPQKTFCGQAHQPTGQLVFEEQSSGRCREDIE